MPEGLLPPVVAVLKANITDFSAKMGEARAEITKTADTSSFDKLAGVGRAALFGIGAAAIGLGAESVRLADTFEHSHARLVTAVRNLGENFASLEAPLGTAEKKLEGFGFTNAEVENAVARLAPATGSSTKAISEMGLAADIARGRHISLEDATQLLVKVQTGHVALLGRLGINVKDANGQIVSQDEAMRRLAATYGGNAKTNAETFAGKMQGLKAASEDLGKDIGLVLIPWLEKAATAAADVASWFDHHRAVAETLAGTITGVLVVAMGAYITKKAIAFGTTAVDDVKAVIGIVQKLAGVISGATKAQEGLQVAQEATCAEQKACAEAGVVGGAGAAATGEGAAGLGALGTAGTEAAAGLGAAATAAGILGGIVAPAAVAAWAYQAGLSAEEKEHHLVTAALQEEALGHQQAAQANATHVAQMLSSAPAARAAGIAISDEAGAILGNKDATAKLSDELLKAIPQYQRTKDEHGLIAAALSGNSDAQRKVNEQLSVSNPLLAQHLSSLFSNINYEHQAADATGDFAGKMHVLGDELVKNKGSLDSHTQAGRDDLTAINNAAVAIAANRQQLVEHGATLDEANAKTAAQVVQFDNVLAAAGLNTQQIAQLNQQYGLIPPQVATQIVADTGQAIANIDALRAHIAALRAESNQAIVNIGGGQVGVQAGSARRLAAGGVVRHRVGGVPAILAEAGGDEVVVPLDDAARARELLTQSGLLSLVSGASGGSAGPVSSFRGGGNVVTFAPVIHVHPSAGMDETALATKVREVILSVNRNDFVRIG